MQKIASLVWFKIFPAHFGGQKGIALFNQAVAEHIPVDCWCADTNEKVESKGLKIFPVLPAGKSQFLNPLVWFSNYNRLKRGGYSFLIVEFPYYALLGAWLKRKVPFILHAHNIEAERFRELKKWWWPVFRAYEKWAMKKADLVLFKTTKDMQFALQHYLLPPEKAHIVPYGVPERKSINPQKARQYLESQHDIKPDEKVLLFAATLDYLPNAEAVESIYFQLAPLLVTTSPFPFKILICGRNKFREFAYLQSFQHKNIIQAGHVADIDLYFAGADVFINPVEKSFGVQTKIVDAVSYDLNTVAYKDAQTGLPDYLLNQKLFIAGNKNVQEFCDKTIAAMQTKIKTPAVFFNEYSWKTIVANFLMKLNELNIKHS